jgi:hypothetical protein
VAGAAVAVAGPELAAFETLLLTGGGVLLASLLTTVLVDLRPDLRFPERDRDITLVERPPVGAGVRVPHTRWDADAGADRPDRWPANRS